VKHKAKQVAHSQREWQAIAFEQDPQFDFAAYLEKNRKVINQSEDQA